MAKQFFVSPIGTLLNPWLSKADTKFNAAGLFHTTVKMDDESTKAFQEKITAAAQAALDEFTDTMTPGEKKKWKLYLPHRAEEDTNGNPTGSILVDFKQNATITLKDGTTKDVKIELRDAKDNVFTSSVFSGSEGRIMFSMRPIKMTSTKEAGVRLDFFKAQITKLVKGSGDAGFGAVEGGFESVPSDGSDDGDASADEETGRDY